MGAATDALVPTQAGSHALAGAADRFADRAVRLAGIAGVLAGWTPDIFWRATPADLSAVLVAIDGDGGEAPPDATTIAALKGQFPDG